MLWTSIAPSQTVFSLFWPVFSLAVDSAHSVNALEIAFYINGLWFYSRVRGLKNCMDDQDTTSKRMSVPLQRVGGARRSITGVAPEVDHKFSENVDSWSGTSADRCPIYRDIHSAIDIMTAYELLGAD
jgi:hypothetical protein